MKGFFEWWRKFFAVDNQVNENTVMGFGFAIVLLVAIFTGVGNDVIWTLSALVAGFFGLGALKK